MGTRPYDVTKLDVWRRLVQGQVKWGQIFKSISKHNKHMFLTQNILRIPNVISFLLQCVGLPNNLSKKKIRHNFFRYKMLKIVKKDFLRNMIHILSTPRSLAYCALFIFEIFQSSGLYGCFSFKNNCWKFFISKRKYLKLRDSSIVELTVLHILMFLFAICCKTWFLTNFRTFSTFRPKSACSDVTEIDITQSLPDW